MKLPSFPRWMLFSLFLLTLSVSVLGQQSSKCCDCPIPSVGIFDFVQDVSPPGGSGDPTSKLDFRDWNSARVAFLAAYKPEVSNDPLCTVHFTSVTLGDQYKDFVKGGFDPGNQAVKGDFDYVLAAKVTVGDAGRMLLKVVLADGTTVEHIWESNASFTSEADAAAAGAQAAAGFAPFFDKICDWWRRKRAENNQNAVEPKITVKPSKEKLNVNDSTSVEITAKDCDDSPLINRKITLSSDNGVFSPAVVTTDASGKTTAQFKATKAGAGLLRAEHDYTSIVKHKPQKAFGSKGVVINDPPSGVWMVTIDATERMESIQRKNDQFSFQIDRKTESKNISVAALVRPTTSSDGTVTFSSGDTDSVLSVNIAGQYTYEDHNVIRFVCKSSTDVTNTEGQYSAKPEDNFAFDFSLAPGAATATGLFKAKGSTVRSVKGSGCDPDPDYNENKQFDDGAFFYVCDHCEPVKVTAEQIKTGFIQIPLEKTEHQSDGDTVTTTQHTGTIIIRRLTQSQAPPGSRGRSH